jgi:hypothetical protein
VEGTDIGMIFEGMIAVGTLLTGIVAVFGIRKVIRDILFKEETLYGDEAKFCVKMSHPCGKISNLSNF